MGTGYPERQGRLRQIESRLAFASFHGCSRLPASPMNEISPPQREIPDSLMLHGFWYRALPSDQLSGSQLIRRCCWKPRSPSDAIAREAIRFA